MAHSSNTPTGDETHAFWHLVSAHATLPTLLQLRLLDKHTKSLADAEPIMRSEFEKPGWARRSLLNAKLRSPENTTRWKTLHDARLNEFAALVLSRHIRMKLKKAPSLSLVMQCLHDVDAQLRLPPFEFGVDTRRGGSEYTPDIMSRLDSLGVKGLEHAIRHGLRDETNENFVFLVNKECRQTA